MDDTGAPHTVPVDDLAPGEERSAEAGSGLLGYTVGLVLASLLTVVSFYLATTDGSIIWAPSLPVALMVLAVAQMGVHLVFFLHLTTGPDNANNLLALGFAVLIILLIVCGSLWIMSHLNDMIPMQQMLDMQR